MWRRWQTRNVVVAVATLLAIILLATTLSLLLPAFEQRTLTRRLESLGAMVHYPSDNNPSLRKQRIPEFVWNLMGKDFWEKPYAVTGRNSNGFLELNRPIVDALVDLPSVECIHIYAPLDGENLRRLRQLPRLSTVFIDGEISANDLVELSTLSGITNLVTYPTTIIAPEADVDLSGFQNLSDLAIFGARIDPSVFRELVHLPALEYLRLTGSTIDEAGFARIGKLSQLTMLYADRTGADDKAVKELANLSNLQTLWLNDAALTDESIVSLAKLTRLEHLIIENTSISPDAVQQLQQLLPHCRIEYRKTEAP